ncbi:adenosylcobalamin-dependent ribonucleoside-diphosphate reductase [Heliobacterium gestii]|uniref:Vitamin B12-dependent ribonucleotide reductase n=1 Tax=Heliomicrobium gestii TaxID=2699 RepID=A0A845L773_HELGE|nr:adenosylcobalamin-dependent ribonucleoside-diphosphate reductase [Heliomicrobium gestii]MBM7865182.1 ribonucleoside-diphosphate reductase alpha chain [Heliomicrobium gestii]MZP41451.1 adenosylcobalamin-dependent ribonucleoside-diphosphate reductase [Heliomicrobium gestii]
MLLHQMKVFWDRYARKGAVTEGKIALVIDHASDRYGLPVQVLAVGGALATVLPLRSATPTGKWTGEAGAFAETPEEMELRSLIGLAEVTPEAMWERVAGAIAAVETEGAREHWREKFLDGLRSFRFVPGGRILAAAGTNQKVTFFNCYVLPHPKDSRSGIMQRVTEMVEIMSRGGGVGINLSSLRPSGAMVKGVMGTSSGPLSWACVFSTATASVEQGGSRQGALMLMLDDWHPDIAEFITYKTKHPGELTKANLSVALSDAFMEAVQEDRMWDLCFPDTDDRDYNLLWDGDLAAWKGQGKGVIVYRRVPARSIWQAIIANAHAWGEPGVVFLERYNRLANTAYCERIVAVNPCGEEGLPPWGVCNLGSLNLAAFITGEGGERRFDFEALEATTGIAVRFLDNVIDGGYYFFTENEQQQKNTRRIGLGTMGLADVLLRLGLRYGSPESLAFIERVYKGIKLAAYGASVEIARERGAFPLFEREGFLRSPFLSDFPQALRDAIGRYGIRNATLLTQAPTGTTSLLARASSGIEPVFAFRYRRRDRLGEHHLWHPLAEAWMGEHPGEELPGWFVTAGELSPEEHIRVQAAIQAHVDASISKTVNAPRHHSVDDTEQVFLLAYREGCKGVTYFRDGCREGVLAKVEAGAWREAGEPGRGMVGREEGEGAAAATPVIRLSGPVVEEVPERVTGKTYRIKSHLGTTRVTVNEVDGEPHEVLVIQGKGGTDLNAMAEALGRTLSLYLRTRCDVPKLDRLALALEQLQGITGRTSTGFGPDRVSSLPDAVALALRRYLSETSRPDASRIPFQADVCPHCGAVALVREEGCAKCHVCGYSEC